MIFMDLPLDELDVLAEVARIVRFDRAELSYAAVTTVAAVLAWGEGRVGEATALLGEALGTDTPGTPGDAVAGALPRIALAAMLTSLGRFNEADGCLDEWGFDAASDSDERWAPAAAIFRSRIRLAAGCLDEAVVCARAGIELAQQLGPCAFVPLARLTLGAAALDRDDLRSAAAEVARYRREPPPPAAGAAWSTYAWLHARVLDARDGPARAYEALDPVYDDLVTHQRLLLDEPAAAGGLVRLALGAGDAERATDVATRAGGLAAENPGVTSLAASAVHARGLLEGDAELLELAATGHCQPWASASAAEDAGRVLADETARDESARYFERALTEYQRAGADRDAARVRSRLRDLGVRRRHGHWERRPIEGWGSLTDTERRVAVLVAEGLTNQQTGARMFLSRHTIDSHLRQIFRKLAISSRVQLPRIVQDRPADPRVRGMSSSSAGATLPASSV